MSNSVQPVNFYFSGLDKSNLINDKTNNNDSRYIIFQNDFLHKKVSELEKEINRLERIIEELEDENESLETSKTSLKGYIKNEGEYNRLSRNLVDIYDKSISNISKHKYNIDNVLKYFGILYISLQILLFIYCFYNIMLIPIFMNFLIIVIISDIYNKIRFEYMEIIKIQNIHKTTQVIKIKEEMRRSTLGNDYLTELVDKL